MLLLNLSDNARSIGNYVISGGQESVLVLWQLDTGRKQFLPHLSSPICNVVVSPNGNSYVVKLADNSVMVLSARELQPFANVTGLQLSSDAGAYKDSSSKKSHRAIAKLHPQHPERLLVAVPASHMSNQHASQRPSSAVLQTFDIRANSHISRQALARTNTTTLNMSPEGSPIVTPDVQHLDIVEDGKWLATVDTWTPHHQDLGTVDSPLRRPETFLKFWKWNASTDNWELVTRIDAPHFSENRHASVLGPTARPSCHEFTTLGEDAILRFWCPTARTRSGLKTNAEDLHQDTWKCRSVVDLKGCLNNASAPLSAACMSFSDDGSVLAVCLPSDAGTNDGLVLLIDARTGTVHYRRTGVFFGNPCSVKFLGKYLIVASTGSVAVWDTVDDVVKPIQLAKPGSTVDVSNSPMLAVNARTQSFSIAARELDGSANKRRRRGRFHIRIYDISSFELVFQESLGNHPVALLSDAYSGDYIVVDAGGSVQRLGCLDKASQKSLQPEEVTSHLNSGLANIFSRGQDKVSAQVTDGESAGSSGKGLAGVFGDTPSFSLPSIGVLFRNVVQTLGSS
jgi:NET1-associated nuclear protein 1 (U3 small nucleolar RNA-associated protein 17)